MVSFRIHFDIRRVCVLIPAAGQPYRDHALLERLDGRGHGAFAFKYRPGAGGNLIRNHSFGNGLVACHRYKVVKLSRVLPVSGADAEDTGHLGVHDLTELRDGAKLRVFRPELRDFRKPLLLFGRPVGLKLHTDNSECFLGFDSIIHFSFSSYRNFEADGLVGF
ncbi:hypothetical protein SDC9_103586 [bioreactor metagenome]|uniref:Uncharacterized protein n=1 Tax=bioreactor metagenome TaxID=1076179 RepID=A0A645AU50_9ZZZZ